MSIWSHNCHRLYCQLRTNRTQLKHLGTEMRGRTFLLSSGAWVLSLRCPHQFLWLPLFLIFSPVSSTDPHESGIHTLPLHFHCALVRAWAGLGYPAAFQAPPGGSCRVREGGQDWSRWTAAHWGQVHQPLSSLPGAGSHNCFEFIISFDQLPLYRKQDVKKKYFGVQFLINVIKCILATS